jgi:signal transduction histidine kinase
VTVGDCPLDDRLESLVRAAREAMVNAAKFSGVDHVDVFVEVDGDDITVFVRDTGAGFDPTAVPDDRRGIAESIIGRMDRHGGHATIRSAPGEGAEVELTMKQVSA